MTTKVKASRQMQRFFHLVSLMVKEIVVVVASGSGYRSEKKLGKGMRELSVEMVMISALVGI